MILSSQESLENCTLENSDLVSYSIEVERERKAAWRDSPVHADRYIGQESSIENSINSRFIFYALAWLAEGKEEEKLHNRK